MHGSVTEQVMKHEFERFGRVLGVRILRGSKSAHVSFERTEMAEEAARAMRGRTLGQLNNWRLKIDFWERGGSGERADRGASANWNAPSSSRGDSQGRGDKDRDRERDREKEERERERDREREGGGGAMGGGGGMAAARERGRGEEESRGESERARAREVEWGEDRSGDGAGDRSQMRERTGDRCENVERDRERGREMRPGARAERHAERGGERLGYGEREGAREHAPREAGREGGREQGLQGGREEILGMRAASPEPRGEGRAETRDEARGAGGGGGGESRSGGGGGGKRDREGGGREPPDWSVDKRLRGEGGGAAGVGAPPHLDAGDDRQDDLKHLPKHLLKVQVEQLPSAVESLTPSAASLTPSAPSDSLTPSATAARAAHVGGTGAAPERQAPTPAAHSHMPHTQQPASPPGVPPEARHADDTHRFPIVWKGSVVR